ncbi:malonyl-CoA decarboxylase [Aureococcus anophagefferens]|nr:malonyl-CoA decarboxylase [Aureococcus anophagefferens]
MANPRDIERPPARQAAAAVVGALGAAAGGGARRLCRSLAAFGTSDDAVARAADLIEEARTIDTGAREAALLARAALKPSYEALAEGLAESAGGARLLLEIRVAALALARREPPVAALEAHLRAVLAARFAPCSLRLDRVSWTGTPPPVLERVVAAEAVHAIDDWPALKQRLGRNRRVHAVARALGGEPLAVVEVALGGEVAASIQGLLAEDTWAASETPRPRRRDLVDAAAAAAAAAGDAATTANGARVDDALFRRLAPCFGLMAHYEYDLAALDARAQADADSGEPGVRAGARDALA